MIKNSFFITLSFLALSIVGISQPTNGLIEYLSIDTCKFGEAQVIGNVTCECGVLGESAFLDGQTADIKFTNFFANNYPSTSTFTLSFYFKPSRLNGNFVLLSKRTSCVNQKSLQIVYSQPSRDLSITLAEDINNFVILTHTIAEGSCWNLVTITKQENTVSLFINGEFVKKEKSAGGTIDLGTAGPWTFGDGPCVGTTFKRFRGNIDEFRYYSRALQKAEIKSLYFQPDIINQRDTTIFIGDTLNVGVINSCADQFTWSPGTDISSRTDQQVKIYPTESITYEVSIKQDACVAKDQLRVIVVDPNEIDCDRIFLANAFTPNDDGKNEVFKIDNPVTTEEIISFQVYDRWGGLVFETTDVNEGWDGLLNGEPAMVGVYVYKVVFVCNGKEKTINGSVTLLK